MAMHAFDALEVPLDGRVLVEASAGTGKTYAITTLMLRLLLEAELGIERALVVTFTEAATAELRDRVRDRLVGALAVFQSGDPGGDHVLEVLLQRCADRRGAVARLEAALRSVDLAPISTIHGFCYRVLHDSAFDSGVLFEHELMTDPRGLWRQIAGDFWVRRMSAGDEAAATSLVRQGVQLATLEAIVRRVDQDPDLVLVPPPAAESEADWRPGLELALDEARAAWDAEAVLELLTSGALNRRSYREDRMPQLCAAVGEFLAAPRLPPPADAAFHRLRQSSIDAATTARAPAPVRHPFFAACDALAVAAARAAGSARAEAIRFQHELVDYARRELPRRKEERGVLSFDDLLLVVRDALRGAAGGALQRAVAQRYPVALVDEFQDTDPVQYEVFHRLYGQSGTRLFLVGDPKQAIYSFRGADVFAYLEAVADTDATRRYTMRHNWRSAPTLVEAVNRVFRQSTRPFLFAEIDYVDVSARPGARDQLEIDGRPSEPLQLQFVPRDETDASFRGQRRISAAWAEVGIPALVASEIADLLRRATIAGRRLGAGDVAVLTRTNKQAFAVQDALRSARIPSVVLGDRSVFETAEAADLQRVLAAVAEPVNGSALRAALTTELLGVTAGALQAMEEGGDDWERWVHGFRALHTDWVERGFVQMMRGLLATGGVQRRLLGLVDGERRLTNLLHLTELLHTAATGQHLGIRGLLHWLQEQRAQQGYAAEVAQIRLESDARAVRITTVHRAKGLEYEVVFCPYLWDGWLLHPDDRRAVVYHDPDDAAVRVDVDPQRADDGVALTAARRESLAENVRLLYVALTRARHRCVVLWGGFYNFDTSALAYLLHSGDDPPPGHEVSALHECMRKADDSALWNRLTALRDASDGAIGISRAARALAPAVLPAVKLPSPPLSARTFGRMLDRSWRIASFSQLVGQAVVHPEDARERDDRSPADAAARPAEPVAAGEPVTLAEFPRGARAGNFFHDLLEHVEFQAAAATHRPLIQEKLAAHGFDAEWTEIVQRALTEILGSEMPVATGSVRLADVRASARLNELEFQLPVANNEYRVTPADLAAALRAHPSAELPEEWVDYLAGVRFAPLHGFLKGFVDLVFEHGGRYYVLDYKTNYLGRVASDYQGAGLEAAMRHGDYFLQYHLYAVAVHRYLTQRRADYRYEEHFGGVLFAFLRGMSPRVPGAGVFFELPPRPRIEALATLLSTGALGEQR